MSVSSYEVVVVFFFFFFFFLTMSRNFVARKSFKETPALKFYEHKLMTLKNVKEF